MNSRAKFNKQMEEKFMKELEDVNLDSDSELDDDYYETQRLKLQNQIQSITQGKVTDPNKILNQLKQLTEEEDNYMKEFQNDVKQLQNINNHQSQVLQKEVIEAIKSKVAAEANPSIFKLSEQQLIQSRIKQENMQQSFVSAKSAKNTMKKKKIKVQVLQVDPLQEKIEKAAMERQLLMMNRQDQLSYKFQLKNQSQLFRQRFLEPKVPKYKQNPLIITIKPCTAPKPTFTNLRPMPNNENNVLPKNSPQIALRNMKKLKKISLKPIKCSMKPVSFVALQNPQSQNIDKNQIKSNHTVMNNEELDQILKQYITGINTKLLAIDKLSHQYQPKFIKKFLDLDEKAMNVDFNDQRQTFQKNLEQIQQMNQKAKFKDLTLTFENLVSLKGIKEYPLIQAASLQFNKIKDIAEISNCTQLIEINLQHNRIENIKGVSQLPWLRYINLSHNKIQKIIEINNQNLEIAILNNNSITQILSEFGPNLRILNLSHNFLKKLMGLRKCILLEQLNLSNNSIEQCEHVTQHILLRKLNLSNNSLKRFSNQQNRMIFLFLNQLDLNNNQLVDVPELFMPSLEKLYLQNNQLNDYPRRTRYLPYLKEINLDHNQLAGFSNVWSILRYSRNVEILRYSDNDSFVYLREKVKQLYQYIFIRDMQSLKIINESPCQTGLRKYYESTYRQYLSQKSIFQNRSQLVMKLERKIQFLLKQNKTIAKIQHSRSKFSQSNGFIKYRSIQIGRHLLQISNFLSSENQIHQKILCKNNSIFYLHDNFEAKVRDSISKIRRMVMRKICKKRKLKARLANNPKIITNLGNLIEQAQKKLRNQYGFTTLLANTMKYTPDQAAIMIQKVWKGYRTRRRFRKTISRIMKKGGDDSFQMEQVDIDMFNQYQDSHQFNFQIPDQINFEDYLIKPQVFEMLQRNKNKREKKQLEKKEERQIGRPMQNNFLENNSVAVSERDERRLKQDEQDEKMMRQWGFKNKATLESFKMKQRLKDDRKKKQMQKNMTAAQRYQKFKQISKK